MQSGSEAKAAAVNSSAGKRKAGGPAQGKAKVAKPALKKAPEMPDGATWKMFAGRRRRVNEPYVWRFDAIVEAFVELLVLIYASCLAGHTLALGLVL